MTTDVLIVTALGLEFSAVRKFITDTSNVQHPESNSQYVIGKFGSLKIALIETGACNVKSSHETDRAILYFNPKYVFFVGIAGGIKDVSIRDLVIANKVIGYEIGKATETFKPRFDSVPSSYLLEQLAKKVARSKPISFTRVFIAPIAAGDKVIASTKTEIYDHLVKYCSDALAVEMEGIGFMEAARPYQVEAIVVRGISDLLNNKEITDGEGDQEIAAVNAASFTFEMLSELSPDQVLNIEDPDHRKILVDKLNVLYPKGPETDDIWKHAGGDVSIWSNEQSRKSQWFTAIDKLSKGGEGEISQSQV